MRSPSQRLVIADHFEGEAWVLEELIRAAGDGTGDDQPQTVLAMLQARIGRFESGPRRAVRAASVFGQTFWSGSVAALLGLAEDPAQVDGWLDTLVAAEVIEPHSQSRYKNEKEYGFRHALVRDAVYSLLTEGDVLEGHRLAAHYLLRVGEPEPLTLAEHCRLGGELEQALIYYMRAGEHAGRMGALPEARQRYSQSSAILDRLADTWEHRRCRIDILLQQVMYAVRADSPEQNLARLSEARSLLGSLLEDSQPSLADKRRSAWVDFLFGRVLFYQNKPAEALRYYQQAVPAAEALGDDYILATSSQYISAAYAVQGQYGACLPYIERAIGLLPHLDSNHERVIALGYYGITLMSMGRCREGRSALEQSMTLAEKSQQPSSLGTAYLLRGLALPPTGDFAALLESAQVALKQAYDAGEQINIYVVQSLIGWAHSFLGHPQDALLWRGKAHKLQEKFGGHMPFLDWFAAADAEIAMRIGELDRALALTRRLVPVFRKEGRLLALGVAEQVLGLTLGRQNPLGIEEADAHLSAALQVMEASCQFMAAARLRFEWADLCRRRGSLEQAQTLRATAAAQFQASEYAHVLPGMEHACSLGWPG